LSLGSIAGFVGNFFLALLPYKLWSAYFRRGENMEQNVDSGKKFGVYVAVTILASVVCALIIAWWIELLGLVPFTVGLISITSNNAIMALILGPILLLALYPRVKRFGLLWTEIMDPEEVSAPRNRALGNVLVWVGGVGGAAVGLILSLSGATFGGLGIGLGVALFLVLILVGTFLLGGWEQVEAAQEMMAAEEGESESAR
jgi:energy-coupling factor transport system substrate-specific component